jgi:predicted nucleotidyltransferase
LNHLTSEILWSFNSEIKPMPPAKAVSNAQSIRLAKELDQKLSDSLNENVEVTLFGSQARGDAAEESDIDVLVLLPSLEKSTLDTVLEIAWEVGFEAGKVISVIPATHDEMKLLSASPFFQAVKREGIPV